MEQLLEESIVTAMCLRYLGHIDSIIRNRPFHPLESVRHRPPIHEARNWREIGT